ncbi:MAG: hypothetical protein QOI80_1588 [Solirubrobacteraceae bacterium]|jgi:hypothetical protein|nr:hypothetical protein [Solirubrobacteraceae bacterium]
MRRALLAIGVAVAAAAPASAGQVSIGSSLTAPATVFESAPVDSVYWNTELSNGTRVRSPVRGEVSAVRIKGRINRSDATAERPNVAMLVQILRPRRHGKVKAIVTSGKLRLPFGGRADRITSYDLQARRSKLCVHKGDYVALATSGGFGPGYPDGAEFQMFGAVPGSAFKGFTGAGKDMDGDVFRGRTRPDQELLLQADIAIGSSARAFCR